VHAFPATPFVSEFLRGTSGKEFEKFKELQEFKERFV
jgi:hypothetical protein